MSSVYIHIPFCQRICHYCDFPKRVSKSSQIDEYLDALEMEIAMYQVKKIDTLYLGGGTPSILNEAQLIKLDSIINPFNFTSTYEFTIECNPEHITEEKVNLYKKMGVNRISLGVQTFNPKLLKLLNRGHTKQDVFDAIDIINRCGIKNINIDLIYAIPLQTIENLKEDLEIVKDLNITHISAYSLILEEKTVFDKLVENKKLKIVENEIEAEMFTIVIDTLQHYGFKHYEISNFAKGTNESKHNKVYWQNKEYYGFGMGASGYIEGVRYYNAQMVTTYIDLVNKNQLPIALNDSLSFEIRLKEEFMLGLRLIDGISIKDVNNKYQLDVLKYFKSEFEILLENEWITIDEHIKLTKKGLFYGNDVFEFFI